MSKSRATSIRPSAQIREIIRRLDGLERRLNRASAHARSDVDYARRYEILEEDRLRRRVARANELRQQNPTLWGAMERDRRARNRETSALNRRLRAEGFRPVELEPSLDRRVKELKRLEALTRARSETHKSRS